MSEKESLGEPAEHVGGQAYRAIRDSNPVGALLIKNSSWDNLVVVLVGNGIGLSLCTAAGDAALKRDWGPMLAGFGTGLLLMAIASSFPFWKNRAVKWFRDSVVHVGTAGAAFIVLAICIYVLGPYLLPQSRGPTADDIASAIVDKLKSSKGAPQVQGFGFATSQITVPSKNYSIDEKQKLLGLIGTISTLLNDKGLPAVQTARVIGYNAVNPAKDALNDVISRGETVRNSLAEIQVKIQNDILQPKNSNYMADLNYVVDNLAKLDQFQRATEEFLNNITNFERNMDSFNQDQRNWVTSLVQAGSGRLWGRAAEEFQDWVQQCNARMDEERDKLR